MAIYFVAFAGNLAIYLQRTYFPWEQVAAFEAKKPAALDREFPSKHPIGTPADKPSGPTEVKDRMLAAIVLHESQAWFFKLSGPLEGVGKQTETFGTFMESVHFDGADSPPHWKLPEGWVQQPGNENRFATLKIPGDVPLELTVTTLPKGEGDDMEYLLANVNRWRGQLSLPSLVLRDMARELKQIKIEGATAYVVDFSGKLGAGGMGRPPFTGGGPVIGPTPSEEPAKPGDLPVGSRGFNSITPPGWLAGKPSSMRRASFLVEDGKQSVDISVTELPAVANNLLDNVNRWRGQVGLRPVTAAELKETSKKIEFGQFGGERGDYVELVGPPEPKPQKTLLGVIAFVGEKAWFVKLYGDAELAEREKANFEAFVRSIDFTKR